ncbi:MAG: S-methyl-5-thioribose-1-phosphate isomerase [Firmicutes bacterium]|nr:S-methyl-5-thioribose-1-phosphate isomerase [Bacillota bacterium]
MEHLRWDGDRLIVLDQRYLPEKVKYVECKTVEDVAKAIKDMVVRGAPLIGISAAYGLVLARIKNQNLEEASYLLKAARPTAVNLAWAVDEFLRREKSGRDPKEIAEELFLEDLKTNKAIGENGTEVVPPNARVLTHCNAGALATAGFGTALGVIRRAKAKIKMVYADETRPYLQGSRLTAWELAEDDIPVTVIADNMAGYLMKQGKVDLVIVGADRIAKNGDTANKIGTYSLAVLAHSHGIPFYVAAPSTTFDFSIDNGTQIPIEERSSKELAEFNGIKLISDKCQVYNPAFDVTPHRFITGIITERGILRAPYSVYLKRLLGN